MIKFDYTDYDVKPLIVNNNHTIVYLAKDNWNDYGYVTSFSAFISHEGEYNNLGRVHISSPNYFANRYSVEKPFKEKMENSNLVDLSILNTKGQNQLISIGETDYYSNLQKYPREIREEIYRQLNDIAFNMDLYKKYRDRPVVVKSFFRDVKPSSYISRYNRLAWNETDYKFGIKVTKTNEPDFLLNIEVDANSLLPSNIHAFIGNNGSGKTYHLAKIAEVASNYLSLEYNAVNSKSLKRTEDGNIICEIIGESDKTSEFIDQPLDGIIYISYSPFDDVDGLVDNQHIKFLGTAAAFESSQSVREYLKSQLIRLLERKQEVKNDLADDTTIPISNSRNQMKLWNKIINDLSFDPEIRKILPELLFRINKDENGVTHVSDTTINKLSSGQQIILQTFAYVINKAVERSLIMIDEPEIFLHPPLITAYIRGLSYILKETNSLCLLSTHSPFVVQEVPKECVHIFKNRIVSKPFIETFGESVSVINDHIFGTAMKMTGFYSYLSDLSYNDSNKSQLLLSERRVGLDGLAVLRAYERFREEEAD